MLSTLPKLADKSFIVGFLLPVVLFFAALLFLFSDVPWVSDILKEFMRKDAIEKIVYIALLIWSFSIIMMISNHLLYQVVEGYRWPISKLADGLPEMRRFKSMSTRLDELGQQWEQAGEQFRLKREYQDLRRELVTQFPSEKFILPTRFGNAIRAFEDYSREVYGADSVPLWIHLSTVIPKEFQDACEDARAQVNFLLNLLFFAVIIFVLSVTRFILSIPSAPTLNANAANSWCISESMCFALLALCTAVLGWISYELAIEKIYAWGGLVKAGFDCYLPDLAKKLGYKLPLTSDDQRKFWLAVSRRAIYHQPFKSEEWPRADDSDQGPEHNETGSPTGQENPLSPQAKNSLMDQENVSEGERREADDANGEEAQNEVLTSSVGRSGLKRGAA